MKHHSLVSSPIPISPRKLARVILCCVIALSADVARAQSDKDNGQVATPEQQKVPPASTTAAPQATPAPDEASAKKAAAAADPCAVRSWSDEARLDQYRREIFEVICGTAARFDRLFGNRRFDEEARRTNGRVGIRVLYDEHDGVEVDGTFKVNVDFPNLEHRLKAFIGREDENDFVRGNDQELDFLPTFFEREGGEEWLAGFGYTPVRGDRTSVDVDAGIEGTSPIDPFVRGRYRYYRVVGDKNLLRARQTLYWTNEKDFGGATRLDFERPFGQRTLARWSGNVVKDGETKGLDWKSGVTLYHGFSPDRAISWYVGADGETEREVPLENYGTSVTYRQRMFRQWFFGEVITGVTWPRDKIEEERNAAFHVGFGFEIQFSGSAFARGSTPDPPPPE